MTTTTDATHTGDDDMTNTLNNLIEVIDAGILIEQDLPYILPTLFEAHGVLTHYAERVAPFHYDLSQKALALADRYDAPNADDNDTLIDIATNVRDFLDTFTPEPADSHVQSLVGEINEWLSENDEDFVLRSMTIDELRDTYLEIGGEIAPDTMTRDALIAEISSPFPG